MRVSSIALVIFLCVPNDRAQAAEPASSRDTPLAQRTRTVLLKVKVTVNFKDHVLREALKELADQVEMSVDRPVLWTYLPELVSGKKVTFSCKDKPLDEALGGMFKGTTFGYVVIAQADDRRDGWIRITATGERGFSKEAVVVKPPLSSVDEDEAIAADKLAFGKGLIEAGKNPQAKAVLTLLAKKYPATKAAAEAKELLEKLDK